MKEWESKKILGYFSGGAIHDSNFLGKIMSSFWGPERWENNEAHKANRSLIQETAGEPRKSYLCFVLYISITLAIILPFQLFFFKLSESLNIHTIYGRVFSGFLIFFHM